MFGRLSEHVQSQTVFLPAVQANDISGLRADERTIAALEVPVVTVSTGSATRNGEGKIEIVEAVPPTIFKTQIDDAIRRTDHKVVKIG